MARKAVCVGINQYPIEGADLRGCVNDARAWAALLTQHYAFPRAQVRLLLDQQATKKKMLAALQALLAGAQAGDVLVFTNSSHGTYVPDTDGDEPGRDEALCPYDCDQHLILDDELRALFAELPAGVALTVISDSCHSGTVTRATGREELAGATRADERRIRFLPPAVLGLSAAAPASAAPQGRPTRFPQSKMPELLLAGCAAGEYSYDALLGGVYHGAMTYCALQAIAEAGYQITGANLLPRLRALLALAGFPQHPQLEGRIARKKQSLFTPIPARRPAAQTV